MHQKQMKAMDDEALATALYEQHASQVLMYLRRQALTKEDAEDLLLEVFLAAIESSTFLKLSGGEQQAWLRRVAHNKLIDHQRRAFRRRAMILEEATDSLLDDHDHTPEQVVLRHENQAQLRECLARLPEVQQEVLHLRFSLGLRSREIAQMLNKSDNAIRMVLSRAMNTLRTIYNQKERGEENNG